MKLTTLKFLLIILAATTATACGSSSGNATDLAVSSGGSTTPAGKAALSNEQVDPLTCQGTLASPTGNLSLELQSLSETAQGGDQLVDTMCAAVYQTSTPGDPFLAVALINFDGDQAAAAHYDLVKAAFVAEGGVLTEADSTDDASVDQFSSLIDRDGIGRTAVLRETSWVVTISVGPTTTESPWSATDLEVIGQSILNRVQD